jgi:hypothetical protein
MENWQEWLPVLATIIYTIIYAWVLKVQKARIDKSEDINKKMDRFMNQFDLNKVEKYGQLIEKTAYMEANLIINDSKIVKQAVVEQIGKELTKATQSVNDKISDEFVELSIFAANVLLSSKHEEQESIKNHFLPLTKSYFDKEFLDSVRSNS